MKKELRRSATDVKICGVCGGIAEYLGVDANGVRLIWAGISLFAGTGKRMNRKRICRKSCSRKAAG